MPTPSVTGRSSADLDLGVSPYVGSALPPLLPEIQPKEIPNHVARESSHTNEEQIFSHKSNETNHSALKSE